MLTYSTRKSRYTYLSLNDKYVPFYKLFEGLFYRVLYMSGISDPHAICSKEDFEYIQSEYANLRLRPGAAECISKLRDAGFEVWGYTAGDLKRVGGYFAKSGVDFPNLKSCDEAGIGKPAPEAYKPIFKQFQEQGTECWFGAAHQWDVMAAKNAGFKTAYCTIYEKFALDDIFGKMDVTADTLPEMADLVIKAAEESEKKSAA